MFILKFFLFSLSRFERFLQIFSFIEGRLSGIKIIFPQILKTFFYGFPAGYLHAETVVAVAAVVAVAVVAVVTIAAAVRHSNLKYCKKQLINKPNNQYKQ